MALEGHAEGISHVRGGDDSGADANVLGDRVETVLFAMFSGLSAVVISFLWVALSLS
jgi:hypothetical protein